MIERIVPKRPGERIERIILKRPPAEMPPPDEFVLRLVEAVVVRRKPVAPAAPPAVPPRVEAAPPEGPIVPRQIELDLPSGTKRHEVNFGIKAMSLNIRTDGDISVRLSRGGPSISVLADDSPFNLVSSKRYIERIWLDSAYGATVKVLCATDPVSVSYGHKELPTAYRWHWAGQITQPAGTYSEYDVYTVPSDRRLVVESTYLSSNVKGVVQQVDMLEWDGATLYRFGGTFFDCQAPLPLSYKIIGGKSLRIRTYNYDTEERVIWVVIMSREESLK